MLHLCLLHQAHNNASAVIDSSLNHLMTPILQCKLCKVQAQQFLRLTCCQLTVAAHTQLDPDPDWQRCRTDSRNMDEVVLICR